MSNVIFPHLCCRTKIPISHLYCRAKVHISFPTSIVAIFFFPPSLLSCPISIVFFPHFYCHTKILILHLYHSTKIHISFPISIVAKIFDPLSLFSFTISIVVFFPTLPEIWVFQIQNFSFFSFLFLVLKAQQSGGTNSLFLMGAVALYRVCSTSLR